jgi:ABC-type Zn uptake system ZnuABC Zn-binding protein ZnuA
MNRFTRLIVLIFALLPVGLMQAQDEPLSVVATTSIIADVARNVGGDRVIVESLVPPDTDVHAFTPTPADVARVADADVVLVNGAGLEDFLGDLVTNAAIEAPIVVSTGIEILAFGGHEHGHEGEEEAHVGILGDEGVCEDAHAHEEEQAEGEAHSEEEHEDEHGGCDPHVWTDPNNVKVWATNIAEAFAAADPAHADTYRANAAAYQTTLDALDAEVTALLATIPEANRVLVTNHEFFGYFAYHYGFEVAGVVIEGGTTLNAPSPQELAELIEVVEAEGVPAIFAEVSAQPELAQAVADATGINVITTIYSDSLSTGADSPASTYVDYLRYNAGVIAAALGGGL